MKKIRKSGINLIENIVWGTHFCQFYQTQKDLMEILIPYFKAGLENNELCIWVSPESSRAEEVIKNFREAIPQIDIYLEKGQIEIISFSDLYIKEGISDSQKGLDCWIKKINQAINNGYNGLRLSEDFSWLKKDWNSLIDYEEKLDAIVENHRIKALCTYYLNQFDITNIIEVSMHHRFALVKRKGKWEKIEGPGLKRAEEKAIQAAKEIDTKSKETQDNLEILLEEKEVQLEEAHRSLKESEDGFAKAQKMAHLGNWKWDIATGKLHWSNEVYRIFARNPQDFGTTYNSFLSHVHPDDQEYLINAIKKGFNGKLQNIDYRILLPDGEERVVNTQAEITFDERNVPVRAEGIIQDITERKRAEEALRKSQERYRDLFTNMTEAFFLGEIICDKNGIPYDYRFLEVNPAFELHAGIKGEQVLGKSHLEIFHKADPAVIEKYGEVALSGKSNHFEFYTQLTNRYLDIYTFSPEQGKFATIFRDITEIKQHEEQTRQRIEEIGAVMEVTPVAIWIGHDPQCHNITGNRMANEFYEAEIGENVSANVTPVRRFFYNGHELTADELPMQKAAFKDIDVHNEEIDVLLPNGEWRGLLGSASPLHDAKGNVRGSVAAFIDITERKKTEAKLKETLDNLEDLVKERTAELEKAYNLLKEREVSLSEAQRIAHIGNWDWDLVTGNIYWSDEMFQIFGFNPQEFEVNYDAFLNYVHPDDRNYVNKAFNNAIKGKKPRNIDYRIILADGEERVIHWQSEVISNQENIPVRMRGTIQDITERKKAEKMLKESEEKLKTLFELLPVGVSITDKQRKILDANLALEKIMGISRSDLLKGTFGTRKYIRSNGTEISTEGFPSSKALREKGSIQTAEIGVIKEDGSVIWTDVTATSLPFSDGQVVIVTRDITESKKAAEELQKAEEKYRIITEQTGQLVYDYNVEEDVVEWTGNIKEITGYNPDKFINATLEFFLSCIHPEDLNMFLKRFEWFVTYGGTYRSEYRFRKENGEYIYFEDHGACLKDEKGMVKRILGAIKDITERKEAEQTFANIEIARKREIHHRIKNNLQVISSLLDLQAEKFKNRKYVEDLDILAAFRESQDRVVSIALIHEELHESKGTDKLDFCSYLEKLVENLFETYRVGNVDIGLNIDLEDQVFFDMDTAVPLGLIVNEIISNSLKYAFKDRDQGKIQIKLCREIGREYISKAPGKKEDHKSKGTNFILMISDNGIGLSENFKIEDSSSLGLQLVSILVDQLEGSFELKTYAGTEFTIRFTIPEKD